MPYVQPQSKLSEIIAFVHNFNGMLNPDSLQLQVWLKDAKELQKKDPVRGFMMQSFVYRMQGKIEASIEYAHKAYRLSSLEASKHYGAMLMCDGQWDEALRVWSEYLQKECTDSEVLSGVILCVSQTLDKPSLMNIVKIFKPSNKNAELMLNEVNQVCSQIDNTMVDLDFVGVNLNTYRRFQQIATKLRSRYYFGNSELTIDTQHNELGKFLIIKEYLHNVTIEDCIELTNEYVEAVIDEEEQFDELQKIVFNFAPMTKASSDQIVGSEAVTA